jgi:BED zinc finger
MIHHTTCRKPCLETRVLQEFADNNCILQDSARQIRARAGHSYFVANENILGVTGSGSDLTSTTPGIGPCPTIHPSAGSHALKHGFSRKLSARTAYSRALILSLAACPKRPPRSAINKGPWPRHSAHCQHGCQLQPPLQRHIVHPCHSPHRWSGRSSRVINSRSTKSIVWFHFRKAQDYKTSKKATCMHCGTTLVASHGSTSTMLNHLRTKHPEYLVGPSGESSPGR